MNTNVKLADFLNITNLRDYKVHLACNDGDNEPLDLFHKDYESWIGWNEHFGKKNDFNRKFILTLIKDYSQLDTYVFSGIFKVINVIYGEKYEIEEVSDYEQYKDKLFISFKRYQGLRGRSFKLETLSDQLRISEIVDEPTLILTPSKIKAPNIFTFATSELSQDAMFSWIMQWADDSNLSVDEQLCTFGKSFISLMTGMDVTAIHTVTVKRQWNRIDILARINLNSFLIIEDKTGTSIHDNQLQRYKDIVNNEYKDNSNCMYCSYVKIENEPIDIERCIQKQGFKTINRYDLLSLLNKYKGCHPLIIDYRNHLQAIEDFTNSYSTLPVSEWGWYAWQGFYKKLEDDIKDSSWSYVANPNGGFLGFWWNFVENDEVYMYLQFEYSKLCFKIECNGDCNKSELRWKYYSLLEKEAKKANINVEKPIRFGTGKYMTIGIVPTNELFGDTQINMQELIEKLKSFENLVRSCMQ